MKTTIDEILPETGVKCSCRLCTLMGPSEERIRAALPDNLKLEFDDLMMRHAVDSMDLGHANSMLDGSWPGWEWIKEEKEKRGWK